MRLHESDMSEMEPGGDGGGDDEDDAVFDFFAIGGWQSSKNLVTDDADAADNGGRGGDG